MFNAWPAFETLVVDDWLVRYAGGYSRRANSASALLGGATLDGQALAAIEALYRGWGQRPMVRLSPLADPALEARLRAAGYAEIEPSRVMVAEIGDRHALAPEADVAASAAPGWLAANAEAHGYGTADRASLAGIAARIRLPRAFGAIGEGGVAVAWGIAVVERGFVTLQNLIVDGTARRRGSGRKLVCSLMAWGRRQGATRAVLQVGVDNDAALALYESLGFADAYPYRYLLRNLGD
jgi:ribosomal protein S18 acetylase RimI-like enzyme